jgi:hypothetical protein
MEPKEKIEYCEEMGTESFAGFECAKCGEEIDTENDLMELCGDPFNGSTMTCPKCDAEYDLTMRVVVELMN